MSNSNINLQTQSSNALHNAIMEAGSKDRPPMLAPGNYVQWKSRIKRYIDTKPNSELIHYCLQNPPYTYQWAEKTVPVAEGSSETTTDLSRGDRYAVSINWNTLVNKLVVVVQFIGLMDSKAGYRNLMTGCLNFSLDFVITMKAVVRARWARRIANSRGAMVGFRGDRPDDGDAGLSRWAWRHGERGLPRGRREAGGKLHDFNPSHSPPHPYWQRPPAVTRTGYDPDNESCLVLMDEIELLPTHPPDGLIGDLLVAWSRFSPGSLGQDCKNKNIWDKGGVFIARGGESGGVGGKAADEEEGAEDTLSVRAVLQSYELVAVGIISERLFDIRNLFLNMVGVNFLRGMRWTGGDRGHYFLNLVEWKGVRRSVFLAGGCGGFGSATLEACRLWYGGMGTWWLYFEGVVDVQPPLAQLSHPPATSVWVEEGYCEFIGRFGGLVGLKWVGAVG
ncbi:hypothetical protein Tco_0484945 [Tanacetum coccineum]